jgi:hypothetical protein
MFLRNILKLLTDYTAPHIKDNKLLVVTLFSISMLCSDTDNCEFTLCIKCLHVGESKLTYSKELNICWLKRTNRFCPRHSS